MSTVVEAWKRPVFVLKLCRHVGSPQPGELAEALGVPGPVEVLCWDPQVAASNEALWSPAPWSVPGTHLGGSDVGVVVVWAGEVAEWPPCRCEEAHRLEAWLNVFPPEELVWSMCAAGVPLCEVEDGLAVHEAVCRVYGGGCHWRGCRYAASGCDVTVVEDNDGD